MTARLRFALSVALALTSPPACSAVEGTQGPSNAYDAPAPVVGAADVHSRAAVEHDLVLTLRRTSTDAFELDRDPKFDVVLANRSATQSYPVVLSSDGSEPGWREPHAYYTVERRASATEAWTPAAPEQLGRCGVYDQDWEKDIVVLEPGKEIVLPWFRFYNQWKLDDASDVRITAHYVYGDHARDLRKVPPALRIMPAYALGSNAIELAIRPPIVLELTLKGPLPKGGQSLASAVEVVAVNRGPTELPFATADSGAYLALEVEGDTDGGPLLVRLEASASVGLARERLAAGARRSVVGAAKVESSYGMNDGFRPRRVRAALQLSWTTGGPDDETDLRIARSPWLTLK